MEPQVLLFINKLVFGGIICFLSIFLLSRTRDTEWMCIVTSCLLSYIFIVLDMLVSFGLLPFIGEKFQSTFELLKVSLPCIFLVIALIIKIIRTRR